MDRTPNQIKMLMELITNTPGKRGSNRYSQKWLPPDEDAGYRFSYWLNGKCIVNQLVPSSEDHTPTAGEWGYLKMKNIPDDMILPREHTLTNESGTLRIHHLTFDRLLELLKSI